MLLLRLLFCSCCAARLKLLYPAGSVEHLLVASVEGVAVGADLHLYLLARGAYGEGVSTHAGNLSLRKIGRVRVRFHNTNIAQKRPFTSPCAEPRLTLSVVEAVCPHCGGVVGPQECVDVILEL